MTARRGRISDLLLLPFVLAVWLRKHLQIFLMIVIASAFLYAGVTKGNMTAALTGVAFASIGNAAYRIFFQPSQSIAPTLFGLTGFCMIVAMFVCGAYAL